MENKTICKVNFGRYYCWGSIPCIEVIMDYVDPVGSDGRKVSTRTLYLSAFRKYAFQVSASHDGDWCIGDTPVFGLETLNSIQQMGPSNIGQQSTVEYITTTIALDAVHAACHYPFGRDSIDNVGFVFPRTYELIFGYGDKNAEFKKFIKSVIAMMRDEEYDKTPYGWWDNENAIQNEEEVA